MAINSDISNMRPGVSYAGSLQGTVWGGPGSTNVSTSFLSDGFVHKDDKSNNNLLIVVGETIEESKIETSYIGDVVKDSESFSELISSLTNKRFLHDTEIVDTSVLTFPKMLNPEYMSLSNSENNSNDPNTEGNSENNTRQTEITFNTSTSFIDYEGNGYEEDQVFNTNGCNIVVKVNKGKDNIGIINNTDYHLFKLNKVLDNNEIFTYLTYTFPSLELTYTEYFGTVRQVNDVYFGDEIIRYENLELVNNGIIESSIEYDEITASKIYINENERFIKRNKDDENSGYILNTARYDNYTCCNDDNTDDTRAYHPWWITLEEHKFAGGSFNKEEDLKIIRSYINKYTLYSEDSLITEKPQYNSYFVTEFSYFIPSLYRYEYSFANDNGTYTCFTNNPIRYISEESKYLLYSNIIDNTYLSINIPIDKDEVINNWQDDLYYYLDKESVEYKKVPDNDFAKSYSEYKYFKVIKELVRQNDSDDLVYNYGSYTYTYNGVTKTLAYSYTFDNVYKSIYLDTITLDNNTFNLFCSTSYTFINNFNTISSAYVTNILDVHNFIDRYVHLTFLSDKKDRIDVSMKLNDTYSVPLYSYNLVELNTFVNKTDEFDINYTQYITEIIGSDDILPGQKFYFVSSYDSDLSWRIGDKTTITYMTDRVYPKNIINVTYNYLDPYNLEFVKYNGSVLNILGYNYGIIPEVDGLAYAVFVEKHQKISTDDSTYMIQSKYVAEPLNTYLDKPVVLGNEYELQFNNEYEYVNPTYAYVINKISSNENTKIEQYDVQEIISRDGYWKRKFDKNIKPLINISYTYVAQPYELSKNNISPYTKNEILGWQNLHKITYNEIKNINVEKYYYTYWDKLPDGSYTECVLQNEDKYDFFDTGNGIDFYAFATTITENRKIYSNPIDVVRKMRIDTRQEVVESVYQDDGLTPLCAYVESSFGISNRKQVVITDQVYVPPTYVDIVSIDPITYKETLKTVLSSDGYYAYAYTLEEVPFKTSSYIYTQSALEIDKFDQLIESINNIKGNAIYYSDPGSQQYESLADAMRDAFTYISMDDYSYLANALTNSLAYINETNNKILNALSNTTYSKLSLTYIDNIAKTLSLTNKVAIDNENINLDRDIKIRNDIFQKISSLMNDQIYTLSSLKTAIANINFTGSASTIPSELKGWEKIFKIGYAYDTTIDKIVYHSVTSKNSKENERVSEVVQETYTYIEKLDEIELVNASHFSLFDKNLTTFDRIGLHLTYEEKQYKIGSYYYADVTYSYQNIADILSELKVGKALPTMEEFIIDVSKQLFINSDFIFSYTSPNEYAKKAIYRANALWDELVLGNYVKGREIPTITTTDQIVTKASSGGKGFAFPPKLSDAFNNGFSSVEEMLEHMNNEFKQLEEAQTTYLTSKIIDSKKSDNKSDDNNSEENTNDDSLNNNDNNSEENTNNNSSNDNNDNNQLDSNESSNNSNNNDNKNEDIVFVNNISKELESLNSANNRAKMEDLNEHPETIMLCGYLDGSIRSTGKVTWGIDNELGAGFILLGPSSAEDELKYCVLLDLNGHKDDDIGYLLDINRHPENLHKRVTVFGTKRYHCIGDNLLLTITNIEKCWEGIADDKQIKTQPVKYYADANGITTQYNIVTAEFNDPNMHNHCSYKEGNVCVNGFVVGSIPSYWGVTWTSKNATKNNILIANSKTCNDIDYCICIDLENANESLRNRLNIVDNPNLIGQEITFYGSLGETKFDYRQNQYALNMYILTINPLNNFWEGIYSPFESEVNK